jgi:decaprenylphospho-beta-D-ribofuranose 2-oxidase
MYSQDPDPNDPTKPDAIYSALYAPKRGPKRQALLFRSTIKPRPDRGRMRRFLLFRPKLIWRIPVEWMMRRPLLCRAWWWIFMRTTDDKKPYMNQLDGYTFFMDGNTRAKKLGNRFWFKMQNIQQTFVVPFDPKEEDWGEATDALTRWLEHAYQVFQKHKVAPTLSDVLFLPEDKLFLMSATTDLAGFASSFSFETSSRRRLAKVKEAFRELSDDLLANFEGRVYLVKNVHASQATLRQMYGDNALDFVRLKRDLDPHCIFHNEFLERTFGELLKGDGYGGPELAEEERGAVTGRFRRAPAEEREPARERPEP